jgi:hypothetical protein
LELLLVRVAEEATKEVATATRRRMRWFLAMADVCKLEYQAEVCEGRDDVTKGSLYLRIYRPTYRLESNVNFVNAVRC